MPSRHRTPTAALRDIDDANEEFSEARFSSSQPSPSSPRLPHQPRLALSSVVVLQARGIRQRWRSHTLLVRWAYDTVCGLTRVELRYRASSMPSVQADNGIGQGGSSWPITYVCSAVPRVTFSSPHSTLPVHHLAIRIARQDGVLKGAVFACRIVVHSPLCRAQTYFQVVANGGKT